jgi:hypothetical protein
MGIGGIKSEVYIRHASLVSFYFQNCILVIGVDFLRSLSSQVLLWFIEYLQTGNLLHGQKRERPVIYKNLSARFKPFRRKPQLSLLNWHYIRLVSDNILMNFCIFFPQKKMLGSVIGCSVFMHKLMADKNLTHHLFWFF